MIKYKKYQNKNDKMPAVYGKWFGRAVHELMEFDEFIEHMAKHHCVYSEGTLRGVLIEMEICLRELLLEGKAVRLDDLGIFALSIINKKGGAREPEDYTASLITGVRMNLYLGKRFRARELYKDAKFKEADKYIGDGNYYEPDPDDENAASEGGSQNGGSSNTGNGSSSGSDTGGTQNGSEGGQSQQSTYNLTIARTGSGTSTVKDDSENVITGQRSFAPGTNLNIEIIPAEGQVPTARLNYVTTPQWMIKMSEKVNDLTGGNEGKKGVVEKYAPFWGDYINNPAVWNHLLQGYFGGMYNTIAKTFDVGVTAAKGELPKIYQTPVINRFLNRPVERDNAGALGEEYYNLTEERDAIQYELRTWQKKAADGEEGAQEHVDEILESPEYKRAEVVSHYETIMKDLKAGERAATESVDKADIKEGIGMYKQQMMEELNALDEGKDPLDAAIEAFNNARTFAEKNKLRMRIERLMMRQNGEKPRTKGRAAEVEKALSYISDEEKESRDTNEKYLSLASADDVRDDARIKAAKAKVKAVNDEYKLLMADSPERAAQFYRQHEKELTAYRIIDQQGRLMNQNKKLLGKGSDQNIMHLIANNRKAMLNAIDKIR